MRRTCWIFLLALAAASCSEAPEPVAGPEAKRIRVEVGSGPRLDIASRTALDPDGKTIRWAAGDKIALWAIDQAGTPQLSAHPFSLWHYNDDYDRAKFTADIPEMAEGSYTYCAVAPVPDAVQGTRASFVIPAMQDGAFNGKHDILVATPVAGGALLPGDNSDAVSLAFTHKMHLLRIDIPVNRMNLPITRLTLTFPVDVTGRLTVDAADPAAAPELTEGDNVVTLNFAEPKDAGDVVYAMIAPTALTSADKIEIKAYTDTKESLPTVMHGKDYLAGHTTPILLTIPEIYRVTRIFFSLAGRDGRTDLQEDLAGGYGCSTLGERVDAFTLTGPEGVDLGNGTNTRTFAVNDENLYEIIYEGEFTQNLAGQYTVTYDSENARVQKGFSMDQPTAEISNEPIKLSVPYLYEEDFSKTTSKDNNGSLNTNNHKGDIMWGDPYGLKGWSGNQYYIEGGKAIVIRHQAEKYLALGTYRGRVDSAPISGIKDGKSVKVIVSFNYSGKTTGGTPVLNYGYTTNQSGLSGYYSAGGFTKGGTKIENEAGSKNPSTDGSFDKIDNLIDDFYITGCTNRHRLSWDCFVNSAASGTNQQWVFIDNVKVSIAK